MGCLISNAPLKKELVLKKWIYNCICIRSYERFWEILRDFERIGNKNRFGWKKWGKKYEDNSLSEFDAFIKGISDFAHIC